MDILRFRGRFQALLLCCPFSRYLLHHSLHQACSGDPVRSSVLSCYHAHHELVQELQLLLGLHGVCCVPRQSSTVHAAQLPASVCRTGRLCILSDGQSEHSLGVP
uniref:Uncharacterized protein n=1 Tax=Cacopsylla melanoneura TaxID=428564 RepID=A0A8D8SIV6_9HEMI